MIHLDETEYEGSNVKIWANKVGDNLPIHADIATKENGPFYCPDTFEELIVRHCIEKVNHFAYKARLSPVMTKEETELHKSCKEEIRDALRLAIPDGDWQMERQTFNEDKIKGYKKVIPDISGRLSKKGHGVIIEIQASFLSVNQIIKRTLEYSKRGGYILWVIPLTEDLGIENFRPRLFERYLHQMYYGRTYYWLKGSGRFLIPVHYDTAYRYIEVTQWFEPGGEERVEGGYDKPYSRVKKPMYGERVDIATNFITDDREPFTPDNEKMEVPACKIFKDNLKHWWD